MKYTITIILVVWHLILFANFIQMLSQNNTSRHLISHFFTIDVGVLRMSYFMTSTKIEFDLAPYPEMIISAILVMRQIFKLLS